MNFEQEQAFKETSIRRLEQSTSQTHIASTKHQITNVAFAVYKTNLL